MTVNQQPERKSIDEVRLVGGPPTDGKGVIDYIFQLTEEAAKPLTLHGDCKTQMHSKPGPNGQNNDESFQECFDHGGYSGYKQSEPQLMVAAYRHGELSRVIQLMLDPQSKEVSPYAHEAAGAAVRKICAGLPRGTRTVVRVALGLRRCGRHAMTSAGQRTAVSGGVRAAATNTLKSGTALFV